MRGRSLARNAPPRGPRLPEMPDATPDLPPATENLQAGKAGVGMGLQPLPEPLWQPGGKTLYQAFQVRPAPQQPCPSQYGKTA